MSKVWILVLALVAFTAAAETPAPEETTWRPGDVVVYRIGCHSQASMMEVAERLQRDESPAGIADCFTVRTVTPASLIARVAGGYTMDGAGDVSAWEILDAYGDTEYILLPDHGGAHEALRGS